MRNATCFGSVVDGAPSRPCSAHALCCCPCAVCCVSSASCVASSLTLVCPFAPQHTSSGLQDLHPFFADLLNVLYDKDHYKLALGQVNTCRHIIDNLSKDYVRLLKFGPCATPPTPGGTPCFPVTVS